MESPRIYRAGLRFDGMGTAGGEGLIVAGEIAFGAPNRGLSLLGCSCTIKQTEHPMPMLVSGALIPCP